jgi:hypothetical protein
MHRIVNVCSIFSIHLRIHTCKGAHHVHFLTCACTLAKQMQSHYCISRQNTHSSTLHSHTVDRYAHTYKPISADIQLSPLALRHKLPSRSTSMWINIPALESWRENSILAHRYQMAPVHIGDVMHHKIVFCAALLAVVHGNDFVEHGLFLFTGRFDVGSRSSAQGVLYVYFVMYFVRFFCVILLYLHGMYS